MSEHTQKILVVDDDRDFRRAICAVLRVNGYEVREESNALAVLKTISEFHPDLVLLDLYMPVGQGVELVRSMKELDIFVPVVVISGRVSVEDFNTLRELGVEDILAKPVNKTMLVEKVKQVLPVRERKDIDYHI